MNKWIKIILIMVTMGAVGAVIGYVFVYNKSHPDFEKKAADFTLTAEELFEFYRSDQASAELKYNGKVVEVSGILSEIESIHDLTIAVFVLDEGIFGNEGIRISMLENQQERLKNTPQGSVVIIKGFVTGYNETDVVMEHGSLIN
ncbi:MAG: hypothetical protein KG029_04315 [Bacteroidetes bacterium]|jgi:hypothetical protein|nr:hypothetical protein [Bacteroidota bacterium]